MTTWGISIYGIPGANKIMSNDCPCLPQTHRLKQGLICNKAYVALLIVESTSKRNTPQNLGNCISYHQANMAMMLQMKRVLMEMVNVRPFVPSRCPLSFPLPQRYPLLFPLRGWYNKRGNVILQSLQHNSSFRRNSF